MRPKACTRCRQWKIGCDADSKAPQSCTPCQNLNVACVFDRTFKRIPRNKHLMELQAEIRELKASLANTTCRGQQFENFSPNFAITTAPPPEQNIVQTVSPPTTDSIPEEDLSFSVVVDPCLTEKLIGDVRLAPAQVTELFRVYLTRCHPWLPFTLSRSIEQIYDKCPLLFWVICAVALPRSTSQQLEPHIKGMISHALDPATIDVETVQALLILCMWPFPFTCQKDDPSFIYNGLAVQIGLQIGLHRPSIHDDPFTSAESLRVDKHIRMTTWLACYVLSQMQASRRGVPVMIMEDFTLLTSFDDPHIASQLSQLCRISRLVVRAANTIGASAQNLTGLLEPAARINMVKLFGCEFASLKRQYLEKANEIVEIAFLAARLQLWSFALHDDIEYSTDVMEIVEQAKQDAMQLIQIGCEKNLSFVPFYVRRSLAYSVLTLVRTLNVPFITQYELIKDHIERACSALSSVICTEGDVSHRLPRMLAEVVNLQAIQKDTALKRGETSTQTRMTASIVCDAVRAYRSSTFGGTNNLLPLGPIELDLDGFSCEDLDLGYHM